MTPAHRASIFAETSDARAPDETGPSRTFPSSASNHHGYIHHRGQRGRRQGIIAITFHAFAHRMEMVRRVLQRLEAVRRVACYDYAADPRLVKTATARLTRWDDQVRSLLEGFELTAVPLDNGRPVVVLSGRPVEVDRAATLLCDRGLLVHAAYAFLPPTGDDRTG